MSKTQAYQRIAVADDFGLSSGVNRAIIHLVQEKKVQAVSCITLYPEFIRDIHFLKDSKIKIGLHLTLTGLKAYPLSSPSKKCGFIHSDGRFYSSFALACRAYFNLVDSQEIVNEFRAQLNHFRSVMKCDPTHIDSHEHIGQLPQIREALIKFISLEGLIPIPIRSTAKILTPEYTLKGKLKKRFLQFQGRALEQQAKKNKHLNCCSFLSVVSLLDYSSISLKLLQCCHELALDHSAWWIVHPGMIDDMIFERDNLIYERQMEYDYLLSKFNEK